MILFLATLLAPSPWVVPYQINPVLPSRLWRQARPLQIPGYNQTML